MKKFLKYTGIGLGSISIIYVLSWLSLQTLYRDTVAFLDAAQNNDIQKMQSLIDSGYQPADDTFLGVKILRAIFTLELGKKEQSNIKLKTIEFLINQNVSINEHKKNKPSLLHQAMLLQEDDIALLLISHGADVNYIFQMMTPLDLSLKLGKYRILNTLLNEGAVLNSFINNNKAYLKAQKCVEEKICDKQLLKRFVINKAKE